MNATHPDREEHANSELVERKPQIADAVDRGIGQGAATQVDL